MGLVKGILLGTGAALLTVAGAQAADLPERKAAPVEYVRVCDAYGAGFFYLPGTDTCLKVGGYVRVDTDYRPVRNNTIRILGTTANGGVVGQPYFGNNIYDNSTSSFYARGAVSLDARTQSPWGTVQTFMRLRQEGGSGVMQRISTQPSLEAAYIRFAGFTIGQAAQPFAFMSSWAYNTHYWTGWPNGVRQLAYTFTFGGGFSATLAATDAQGYNGVAPGPSCSQLTGACTGITAPNRFERNGIVWVGNVRYDQSWGSAQIMGAFQHGGVTAGGFIEPWIYGTPAPYTGVYSTGSVLGGNTENGYALGAGVAINLPMIAGGDRLEVSAVWADRIANLLADQGLNSPSVAAYITNPLGGPGVNFSNGSGYSLGAQFRHYWTPMFRSQIYASYTQRKLHSESDGLPIFSTGYPNYTVAAGIGTGGKGTAWSLGHAFIWSPVANFDIGLELNYLKATWNQAAVRTIGFTGGTPSATNNWTNYVGSFSDSAFIGKLRVQRDF